MRISDWSSDVCSSDLVERIRKPLRNGTLAVRDWPREPEARQVEPCQAESKSREKDLLVRQRGAEERRQQQEADRQAEGEEEADGVVVAHHVGAHEAGLQQAALHERAVRFVDQWHPLLDGSDQVYTEGVARPVTQARRAVCAAPPHSTPDSAA